jgi:PAS domain S-box-containing protein
MQPDQIPQQPASERSPLGAANGPSPPVGLEGAAQLQQALHQAQANLLRYQELFDFAPDAYLVTDRQGVIRQANYAAAVLLGTRTEFLVGKPLLFYVASTDRRVFSANLYQLSLLPGERVQWEMTLCPPRSDPVSALVTASAASTQEWLGTLHWSFRDNTWRRQAEEALRAEKEFTDSLIDLAEVIILVLDLDGRILRANRCFCTLTGHTTNQVTGRSLADFLVAEDQPALQQHLSDLVSAKWDLHSVHRLRTRNGRTRTVAWSKRILTADSGRSTAKLVVGNDITDLQEAQDRAVQVERLAAIGQMITGLAHESRNALQRSQSCLALLGFRVHDQPEALNLVERVQKAQDDLHHLYEGVREYAAPIRLTVEVCDLARLWQEAWEELGVVYAGRAVDLREEIQASDLRCEGSPFHLKQMFRNLLHNALTATGGPVRVVIRCSAAQVEGREGFRIAVQDNGPGFAPDQRLKAFEPFFTTKVRGTGLGLAICKRLVEAHGGRIALGEAEGPGAVILITLPRRRA